MKTDDISRERDEFYMKRALQLAALGAGHVSPNPMVGAVIVAPDGRIIGEGFHRRFGEAHAEVNAFQSIGSEDRTLIPESTIYVTLEPCSHYGKTPPCALLLKTEGIKRCVVGTGDPNPKVAGRGIAILREAGIEVTENVLQKECLAINERFFTAQMLRRPWILLKWAQSTDGFIALPDGAPIALSTPATLPLMHRERSMCDAILVGTGTLLSDNPSLSTRLWPGNSPRPVVLASPRTEELLASGKLAVASRDPIILDPGMTLADNMKRLFSEFGITSLMVEGGASLLKSFIDVGLFDKIRIETSPIILGVGIPAPHYPHLT